MIRIDFSEEIIELQSERVLDPLVRVTTCSMGDLQDEIVHRPFTEASTRIRETAAATSRGNLGQEMRICERDLRESGVYVVTSAFRGGRVRRFIQLGLEVLDGEETPGITLRMVVDPSSTTARWIINDDPIRIEEGVGWSNDFHLNLEVNERLGTVTMPEVPRRTMWDRIFGADDE